MTTGASPFARSASTNRRASTASWTRRSTRRSRRSPTSSSRIRDEGQLATEPTLVWILFDADNIYIAARCRDSQPSAHRRQRHAPRRQQRQPERQLQRHPRHLPRSAQRLRVPDELDRRRVGHADHRRARRQPRLEHGLGPAQPPRRRGLDASRWRSRSDRCAIAAADRRSGASTSAATSAGRTSSRT